MFNLIQNTSNFTKPPIRLYHSLDGVTNHKYELLHFLITNYIAKTRRPRHLLLTGIGAAI
jgi:hypothetical protein